MHHTFATGCRTGTPSPLRQKKIIGKNSVSTAIEQLTQKERVEELARMLSGTKVTQQTIAHAESLLACQDSS